MNRQLTTRLALLFLLSISFVVAFAQKPVGSWTGKIDFSDVKAKNKQEQTQIDQFKKMIGSASIALTIKGDKSYQLVFPPFGGMKGETEAGTWTQKGASVNLVPKKGKASSGTISSNGKKFVLFPPADSGPKGLKVVFKKG